MFYIIPPSQLFK